jgi:hypothetical protein
MRESRTYGSERGAPSNGRPYRDLGVYSQPSRLIEGRLPETVPLGGAGSGFLRLWLVPSLAGVVGHKGRGEKCRGGAPRGETSRSQGT